MSRWDCESHKYNERTFETRYGVFVEDIEKFDNQVFRVSPFEASMLDPQQRLLLECVLEVCSSSDHVSIATSISVGVGAIDYLEHTRLTPVNSYLASGSANSAVPGRLSFAFGFTGASVAIDTACSSSLVALDYSFGDLRNLRSQYAITAGVNLTLSCFRNLVFSVSGMIALDGRCKTLSSEADGYVRAESCLSMLSAFVYNTPEKTQVGQCIGIVAGSCVNQDGRSTALTSPNGPAQQNVIQKARQESESSHDMDIEMHGTGTALGDPIEVGALLKLQKLLRLSAAKTRFGHSETAAGIRGVFEALNRLEGYSSIENPHLRSVNPMIKDLLTLSGHRSMDMNVRAARGKGPEIKFEISRIGVSAFAFQVSVFILLLTNFFSLATIYLHPH